MKPNRQEMTITEQAAEWCVRLKQSHDPADRVEFVRWVKQSPLHIREMLAVASLDQCLGTFDLGRKIDVDTLIAKARTNVVPLDAGLDCSTAFTAELPSAACSAQNPNTRLRRCAGLIAAAGIVAMLALGWWHLDQDREPLHFSDRDAGERPLPSPGNSNADSKKSPERLEEPQPLRTPFVEPVNLAAQVEYKTATGEQRSLRTVDGSLIHLNTQSTVRFHFSEQARDVYLTRGQAIFEVAHDATRPFRVHFDNAVAQAVGTTFDVRRFNDRTRVTIIAGSVQIKETIASIVPLTLSSLPTNANPPKGQSVVVTPDGKLTRPTIVDANEATAWRSGQVVFRRNTLAEISEEFNRYNKTPKLRVEGDALKARHFTGVFAADDPAAFLDFLGRDTQLVVDHSNPQMIVIRPISEEEPTDSWKHYMHGFEDQADDDQEPM